MAATEVIKRGEVTLFGTKFPIEGEVQEQSIANFAPKQVVGDVTRSDQQLVSQWIMNDWRGGMGVYDYAEPDGVDKFYESTAETRIRGQLRLPRKQNPSSTLAGTPSCMASWGTVDYVAAGSTIYANTGTAGTVWNTFGTAGGAITDMIVYKNNLFAAAGTAGYWYHNGSAASTITAGTAYYWTEYDSKLLMLSDDSTGLIKLKSAISATPGTADWTINAAVFGDTVGAARKLDTYVNTEGRDAPYVFTTAGVRVVDFDKAVVYKPRALQFPDLHTDNCRAFTVNYGGGEGFLSVKGEVYRISGQNVYPLSPMGEQGKLYIWRQAGWGKNSPFDPGTPKAMSTLLTRRGIIRDLISTERYVLAVVDRMSTPDNGVSSIIAWNGRSWSTLVNASASMKILHHSRATAAGNVLWYNRGTQMYNIDLPDVSDDPWLYSTTATEPSATHQTSWYDGNFAEVDKLALAVDYRKLNAGGSIVMSYGMDYNDTTWTTFATITASGTGSFAFNSNAGTVFRAMRFQFDLSGGGTVDPVLEFASLKYALVPDKLRSWSFKADCSDDYGYNTAAQLTEALKTAEETKTLGVFSFRPNDDRYVKVIQRAGKEVTGLGKEGHYAVVVTELT